MSIEDQFRSLTRNEKIVLYYKCKGLKRKEIARKVQYGEDWVQGQMGGVYTKLGFKKEMHWTQRVDILNNKICPLIPKNLDEWLGNTVENTVENAIETTEESRDEFRPVIPELQLEPAPDPAMVALVIYDEQMIEETGYNKSSAETWMKEINVQPLPPGQSCLQRILLAAVLFGIIVIVGYGAYIYGRGSVPETPDQAQVITATFPPTSEVTNTPLATEIPTSTLTYTPEPTFTPLPTATAKAYFDENEAVLIKDGIYMYLSEDFTTAGGPCGKPDVGFGVKIVIEDNINEQFLIRFDSGKFKAVDNLGNEYKLEKIGVSGSGFCSDMVGVPLEYTMTFGYFKAYIVMQFKGQLPLEATHIFITADWISGVGPTTFRKTIY